MAAFSSLVLCFLALCGTLLPVAVDGQGCGTSQRRSWRALTCGEQQEFLDAVQALKDSGMYDDFVRVHFDSAGFAHNVAEFLPWHRWFLWVFERELQSISGSCVTIPYWDAERGDTLPIVLRASTFGTNNGGGCATDGIANGWAMAQPGRNCLERDFDASISFSRDAEVLSRVTNNVAFADFTVAIEGSPHSGPHDYIGGPMRNDWAADGRYTYYGQFVTFSPVQLINTSSSYAQILSFGCIMSMSIAFGFYGRI